MAELFANSGDPEQTQRYVVSGSDAAFCGVWSGSVLFANYPLRVSWLQLIKQPLLFFIYLIKQKRKIFFAYFFLFIYNSLHNYFTTS